MTLGELRALSDAADEGPWTWDRIGGGRLRTPHRAIADLRYSHNAANADLIAAAVNYVRERLAEADQPIYLGCGCVVGTHENSMDAMKIAHPDLIVPEITGPFYGSSS